MYPPDGPRPLQGGPPRRSYPRPHSRAMEHGRKLPGCAFLSPFPLSLNNLLPDMSDDEILNRASYYELLSLYVNRNTPLAARLSCGGTIDAALSVTQGRCQRALAIVRPPGHHAEPREFMGFCFYNNVAVATKVVQARTSTRVLILDW
jgi:acetoin utilization deacetylase AcuC-like enzyme